MAEPEDRPALTVGAVVGDSDSESTLWADSIQDISRRVRVESAGVRTPVGVAVEFFVNGRLMANEFDGVRTGSLLRGKTQQVIQVAINREILWPDPRWKERIGETAEREAVLLAGLQDASDLAQVLLRRKGLADGLPELRAAVQRLRV